MQARLIKQDAERCLADYQNHSTTLSDQDVSILANRAVTLFFEFYQFAGAPLRPAIELLCEINASHIPSHAALGLEALFPNLIEKLNDAFLPAYCDLYDRVFAQVISFFRHLPEGHAIDQALHRFGLHNESDLLRRKRNLARRKNRLLTGRPLKKILFLSRVTIGADVAVTSVLIAHLKKQFLTAEIVFIGSQKLSQLYGGDTRIRVRQIDYGRSGKLLSRLETWLQVLQAIESELSGLKPKEYCIFDPDSRLTQLGLLPVLLKLQEEQSYFFFPSRSYLHSEYNKLSQLAAAWINQVSEQDEQALPFICLAPQELPICQQASFDLQDKDKRPIICLSFGVGGNVTKRVSQEFEISLASALSQRAKLIIDCGATIEEHEQVKSILSTLAQNGRRICPIQEVDHKYTNFDLDILTWQGNLGTFASLVAASDLYVGYDSAGQHIAAALNVPTLTIFVSSGEGVFRDRWQPHGLGRIKTIYLDPSLINEKLYSLDDLLAQIMRVQEQLLMRDPIVENSVENSVEKV
jgi:ADP-heptose:LPS heptosyltransferase